MAYKFLGETYNIPNAERMEIICDTDADFDNLPEAAPGSCALSVATGNIRAVNASGNWVAFGEE